jgi:hypothetical protein
VTLKQAFNVEGAEISLVQNRLNVAALALTALVFSGSFTLSLYNSFHPGEGQDFRKEFLHILTALSLGVIASLASIACFLQSQQAELPDGSEPEAGARSWFHGRQWWFSLGQLFLYMALSQALSASLTEVVYGVSLMIGRLGLAIGIVASLVWWSFLFGGPIAFFRRMRPFQSPGERFALYGMYLLMLFAILLGSGAAYSGRGGLGWMRTTIQQLYQPLTWHQSWLQ